MVHIKPSSSTSLKMLGGCTLGVIGLAPSLWRVRHAAVESIRGMSKKAKAGNDAPESDFFITPRSKDYSQWYLDVIAASELAENSPVKGCMVIRPWGMSVWDEIRDEMNRRIKATGAQNAYFPVMIPLANLSKEAGHVDGFAKECAVVTHHRLIVNPEGNGLIPDPSAKLEEPLVIRPTSEAMIWDMFRKWIHSYRDLPIKLNQWANVVRWEMRTRPFLRTSEFLWQEGHTAHATRECAMSTTTEMIDEYADFASVFLAIPVVKGVKSPSERFAGADETFTIEALMQNGWALQTGTSHFLGQNFGKAFGVEYTTSEGTQQVVWATSWGVSTRLMGALIMTHADDKGLVLPPRVAPIQVVIVPVGRGKSEENDKIVDECCSDISSALKSAGIRFHVDNRDHLKPGPKFFYWERRGVPLRLEVGPREAQAGQCVACPRIPPSDKSVIPMQGLGEVVVRELDRIQAAMLGAAKERLEAGTRMVDSYAVMRDAIQAGDGGMFLAAWTEDAAEEAEVKMDCKATIRCYPKESNGTGAVAGKQCFKTGRDATHMALFARAF